MPRNWKMPGARRGGSRAAACLAALAAVVPALLGVAGAASPAVNQYTLLTTIPVPQSGDGSCASRATSLGAFDISFTDARDSLYLLADRTNCGLDVFDTSTNAFLFRVGGFAGNTGNFNTSGPDGVLTVNDRFAYAGDGNSTVKIIDLLSQSIVDTVGTGGANRADEMVYDPRDNLVMVANDAESPSPFVSFISTIADNTGHHNVVGKIVLPDATGGLEQSVWSRKTGLIYLSVPTVGALTTGEIAVINPRSRTIVGAFPVNCQPAGLAIGPNLDAIVGCGDNGTGSGTNKGVLIISLTNGSRVAGPFSGINGVDEVWFNRTTKQYFAASGNSTFNNGNSNPVLGVIDATNNTQFQTVSTTNGDHSVAVDPVRAHVFLPDTSTPPSGTPGCGCIQVYHQQGQDVAAR